MVTLSKYSFLLVAFLFCVVTFASAGVTDTLAAVGNNVNKKGENFEEFGMGILDNYSSQLGQLSIQFFNTDFVY